MPALKRISVDTHKVDWEHIIECSVNRNPPFEAADKEKGFKDAIIAQTFLQLLEISPTTPNICRLALVSEDNLLRQYVVEATKTAKNVRILTSLDELESLINTLVSTIPEDFATELAEKAGKLFFDKNNDKSIYYKESIGEKIREQYSSELTDTILPGSDRENNTWWIIPPIFKKKEKQRIYWVSNIEPEFEIFHYEKDESKQEQQLNLGHFLDRQNNSLNVEANPAVSLSRLAGLNALANIPRMKRVTDFKGRERFEVLWSANLSTAQNLTSPKLEDIRYLGNSLGEGNS